MSNPQLDPAGQGDQDDTSQPILQFFANFLPLHHGNQRFRHNNPRRYILPTHSYQNQVIHHQYDAMGRLHRGRQNDRYLSPTSGRMKRLVVQATGDVCKHSRAHTWGRVNIKKRGPSIVNIANWPWNYKRGFPLENNPLHWLGFIGIWILTCIVVSILQLLILSRRGKYTGYYSPLLFKLWEYPKEWKTLDENAPVSTEIPAANPLYSTSLALEPKSGEHAQRPHRLCVINTVGGNVEYEVKDTEDYEVDKVPPYVFISFTSAQFPCQKGRTRKASQSGQPPAPKLRAQPGRPTPPTGQPGQLADQVEEMEWMDGPYGAQLVSLAIHATLTEGEKAFWLSEQCLLAPIDEVNENMRKNNMPEIGEKEYNEEKTKEIHIMSDIIRGAAAIVIILGQPPGAEQVEEESPRRPRTPAILLDENELLENWGGRMWTFPELLMSKNEKIKVYYACDMDGMRDIRTWNPKKPISCQPPPPPSGAAGVPAGGLGAAVPATYCGCKIRPLTKKIIAEIAWVDHQLSSQMIDHFDGKINLSRLELVKITLHCLNSRGMDQKYDGDLSYVLMGLLRRRPKAYITDSAFMAFARLSFANDSDRLLERMVCILPKPPSPRPNSGRVDERGRDINSPARISRNVSWIALEDHWSANLWDIEPLCQVAGIGSLHDLTQETIILDGCFGASIRWKGFARVAFGTKWSWKRDVPNGLLRLALVYFIGGMLIATLFSHPVAHFFGIVFFLVGWLLVFTSPVIVQRRDTGKVWDRQPWLFGFEGHLKIETIEETLFGSYDKRLTWSAAGSTSSHHQRSAHDRREGCDPCLKTSFAQRIRDAQTASNTDERVFTLVDTGTMTALSFLAVKPPSAAIVCGQEGGMLRVALCGYDWTSNTLYRETVIRMETTVQDKMKRVGRLKFAFQRSGTLSYEVSNPSH